MVGSSQNALRDRRNGTHDYDTLTNDLGAAMTIHGAVMVVAGLGFGYAVVRAQVLPVWTAVTLMVGVVLVASTQNAPEVVQLVAAGVRDLGFGGMGVALLSIDDVAAFGDVGDDRHSDLSTRRLATLE